MLHNYGNSAKFTHLYSYFIPGRYVQMCAFLHYETKLSPSLDGSKPFKAWPGAKTIKKNTQLDSKQISNSPC